MKPPSDPLDSLLDRWEDPADKSRSLAPEVWRRLDRFPARGPLGLLTRLLETLGRPPVAAMFVACCAILGLYLAEVRINRQQREESSQLARSYLQLIDPLLKADVGPRLP
ncbi:MAG TPA: hypothetical protein VGG34_10240 [Opitutaceae bacterium]|jgi:hypothetical protein